MEELETLSNLHRRPKRIERRVAEPSGVELIPAAWFSAAQRQLCARSSPAPDDSEHSTENPSTEVPSSGELPSGVAASPSSTRPTALAIAIRWSGLLIMVATVPWLVQRGWINDRMNAKDVRVTVCGLLATFGVMVCTLLVDELRVVLTPRNGELHRLGLDVTRVRASSFGALVVLRKQLRIVRALFITAGVFLIPTFGVGSWIGGYGFWSGLWFNAVSMWMLFVGPRVLDFILALDVAAALASDSLTNVISAVETTPLEPDDQPPAPSTEPSTWESKVVAPALALHTGTIEVLSDGFGTGLATAYLGFWTIALCFVVFASTGTSIMNDGVPLLFRLMFFGFAVGGCASFLYLPMAMSRGVADVSTSCDDLSDSINKRRIEDLNRGVRLMQLELALNNTNARQGLGFVIGGTVLDKKKLRVLFGSVFSIFTTVIPIILAFSDTENTATIYGQRLGSPKIYAFSPVPRSFAESTAFCESIWMEPASIHSAQENADVVQLLRGRQAAFIGAVDANALCATDGSCAPEPRAWRWVDGSPWDYENWSPGEPDGEGFPIADQTDSIIFSPTSLAATQDAADGHGGQWNDKRGSQGRFGVVCSAPSLSAIRGTLPVIQNLGRAVVEPAPRVSCELTASERQVSAAFFAGLLTNRSCSYSNVTVDDLLAL